MYIACLTITSIAFGSLFATPQLLLAQGGANETFFEAAVREAGQTEQPNQTAAAPAPSPQPSSTEQPNQTATAPLLAHSLAQQSSQIRQQQHQLLAHSLSSTEQPNQTATAPAPSPQPQLNRAAKSDSNSTSS